VAAIAWVNWYFFLAGRSGATTSPPPADTGSKE
jgi:hypothetical protein